MATPAEILELRIKIAEPVDEPPYTDEVLGELIDANPDTDALAKTIWEGKAASVAHLVDISEGGSSRKMSDMYKNFLAIAKTFEPDGGAPSAQRAPMTREITRA